MATNFNNLHDTILEAFNNFGGKGEFDGNKIFFSFNVFASFPKQTFFLSCISHILSQFTISLSGKELMTIKKRPFENIMGKEQSHTFF